MSWAGGLNGAGVLTYNFNAGITMNWSDNWRLPTTVDGVYQFGWDGTTTGGFNITNSELGHLYYTELGNLGAYDTDGNNPQPGYGLTNTGDFQNLQASYYWSDTEYSANRSNAWLFYTHRGGQNFNGKEHNYYAIAVRPGLAVVPEPISSILFITGGAILGFRRFWGKKKKKGVAIICIK